MAALSVTALNDAIADFEEAIELAEKHKKLGEMNYYRQFRTSAIHSFEYSYELAGKLIRRYIENADNYNNENSHLDFRNYMRVAAEYGLLEEPEEWVEFREWRNKTSHAYDSDIAENIFRKLPSILISMKATAKQLEERGSDVSFI